jgi:hypothetical protein
MVNGWCCGMWVISARYHDVDPMARERVRLHVSKAALRNKNKFSIETATEVHTPDLSRALLSDHERQAKRALVVCVVGPSLQRPWRENTQSMYSEPIGVTFDPGSGWLFYADRRKGVRALRVMHVPGNNVGLTSTSDKNMKEPSGVCLASTGQGTNKQTFLLTTDPGEGCIWVQNLTRFLDPKKKSPDAHMEDDVDQLGSNSSKSHAPPAKLTIYAESSTCECILL